MRTRYAGLLVAALLLCAAGVAVLRAPRGSTAKAASSTVPSGKVTVLRNTYPERPYALAFDQAESVLWVPLVNPQAENKLLRLSLSDSTVQTIALPPAPGESVYCGVVTDSDNVWVSWDDTLARVSKKTGLHKTYDLPAVGHPLDNSLLPLSPGTPTAADVRYSIRALCDDSNGSLWFARCFANSLLRFDKTDGVFTEYVLPTEFGSPADLVVEGDSIWCTVALGPGRVANDKLLRFSIKDNKATVYPIASAELRNAGALLSFVTTGGELAEMDTRDPGHVVGRNSAITARDNYARDGLGNVFVAHEGGILLNDAAGVPQLRFQLPTRTVPIRGVFGAPPGSKMTRVVPARTGTILADGTGGAIVSVPDACEILLLQRP
jgi:streptogramin lyase